MFKSGQVVEYDFCIFSKKIREKIDHNRIWREGFVHTIILFPALTQISGFLPEVLAAAARSLFHYIKRFADERFNRDILSENENNFLSDDSARNEFVNRLLRMRFSIILHLLFLSLSGKGG